MLAVRSNWTPPFSLKSASNTTFFHGPEQLPGGVTPKFWVESEKCAKVRFAKRGTTQGCSEGRGTRGSAVTVNWVPICRFVLWAETGVFEISDAASSVTEQSSRNRRLQGFIADSLLVGYFRGTAVFKSWTYLSHQFSRVVKDLLIELCDINQFCFLYAMLCAFLSFSQAWSRRATALTAR